MENLKVVINLYFDDERYFYQFFYVTAKRCSISTWDVTNLNGGVLFELIFHILRFKVEFIEKKRAILGLLVQSSINLDSRQIVDDGG